VRRRFSEFEWLKKELENSSKVSLELECLIRNNTDISFQQQQQKTTNQMIVPPLPEAPWSRHLPSLLRKDEGLFDESFIEERRKGLEDFINKYIKLTSLTNVR
jgi:sorting nexin-3/12